MPSIHVSLPDGSEVTHELTDETISVGRVSDNAIQIEDASVSSHHAEFYRRGDDYVVKDIGSTNGSQYNGETLPEDVERRLKHGDTLIFGSIPIRYLTREEAEVQPLPPAEPEPALAAATNSVAPQNFSNASPFPKRDKEKDKSGTAVMAVGVLALLTALAAVALVFQMQAP